MDSLTPKPSGSKKRLYAVGFGCMVVVAGGTLLYMRQTASGLSSARAAMEADLSRGPRVVVTPVKQGPEFRTIQLLGDARPYLTTTIFAKVSGYLKNVHVDKGSQVTANQVLAEIDSAELESQYLSALTDLTQKEKINARLQELLKSNNTSQQAAEQAETNYRMAQEAVRNLAIMRSYQSLKAPFDGTVVARFADPGALVQAATTNQASSLPVLQIVDNSKLRVGVFVEQRDVASIKVGDEAEIVDASNPDRKRKAQISRTAGTLDPRTRTMYVEIDLDNADQFLVPGSFVYVNLRVPVKSYLQIPVAALVQRGGNPQVAVVGSDAVVQFKPIKVASTDGAMINVADGLKMGEKVALNISSDLSNGAKVRPAERN